MDNPTTRDGATGICPFALMSGNPRRCSQACQAWSIPASDGSGQAGCVLIEVARNLSELAHAMAN